MKLDVPRRSFECTLFKILTSHQRITKFLHNLNIKVESAFVEEGRNSFNTRYSHQICLSAQSQSNTNKMLFGSNLCRKKCSPRTNVHLQSLTLCFLSTALFQIGGFSTMTIFRSNGVQHNTQKISR